MDYKKEFAKKFPKLKKEKTKATKVRLRAKSDIRGYY